MCIPFYCPNCTQCEEVITQVWDLHIEKHCSLTFWLVIFRYCLFMGCFPQPDLEITVNRCKFLAIWKKQRDYSGTDLELGTGRDRELSDCIQQELSVWSLTPKSCQPHWGKRVWLTLMSLTDTNTLILRVWWPGIIAISERMFKENGCTPVPSPPKSYALPWIWPTLPWIWPTPNTDLVHPGCMVSKGPLQ